MFYFQNFADSEHSPRFQPWGRNHNHIACLPRLKPWAMFDIVCEILSLNIVYLKTEKTDLKNHLKYLISFFVALVVMAGDGVLYAQSNSPEYYQSSFVVSRKEIDLKNLRVYVFNQVKRSGKISFPILSIYFRLKDLLSFQTQLVFQLYKNLHQEIISFVKQSVFINEIITSSNFKKSLYTA